MNDEPEWLPDGATVFVENEDMRIIHEPESAGEVYILDLDGQLIELSHEQMRVLDELLDEWFFSQIEQEHSSSQNDKEDT